MSQQEKRPIPLDTVREVFSRHLRERGIDPETVPFKVEHHQYIGKFGGEARTITITVLTLAATHTLGIAMSPASALVLCIVASLAACGASGVPSGSLLLVPLACSLFGIPYDVSLLVVAVGFIISVVQDSFETALYSSTDVIYTYAVDRSAGWPSGSAQS